MLAKYISWIVFSWNVMEHNELGCNCFPNTVKGKCSVSLVELGMRRRRGIDNGFIIAKHITRRMNRDS